jgi:hypothetical protein
MLDEDEVLRGRLTHSQTLIVSDEQHQELRMPTLAEMFDDNKRLLLLP